MTALESPRRVHESALRNWRGKVEEMRDSHNLRAATLKILPSVLGKRNEFAVRADHGTFAVKMAKMATPDQMKVITDLQRRKMWAHCTVRFGKKREPEAIVIGKVVFSVVPV